MVVLLYKCNLFCVILHFPKAFHLNYFVFFSVFSESLFSDFVKCRIFVNIVNFYLFAQIWILKRSTMNTKDLITTIRGRLNMPQEEAERLFDSTVNTLRETLLQGNNVALQGFGVFETKKRMNGFR